MTVRANSVPAMVLMFFMLVSLPLVAQNENGSRVIPVFADIVKAGTINRKIETSADILPLLGVDVHPDVGGRIVEIFVDVGSAV